MQACPLQRSDDTELVLLRSELHEAAMFAELRLKAMPDYADTAEEAAAIEAILQPGEVIADQMLSLQAATSDGVEARLRATLWKRGEYIGTYLGEE
jgi:hypothetical protein